MSEGFSIFSSCVWDEYQNMPIFERIEGEFIIPRCSGSLNFSNSSGVLNNFDKDFAGLFTDPSSSTEECRVVLDKLNCNKSQEDVYRVLSGDIRNLTLTPHQIIKFCEINRGLVSELKDLSLLFTFTYKFDFYAVYVASDFGVNFDYTDHRRRFNYIDDHCIIVSPESP